MKDDKRQFSRALDEAKETIGRIEPTADEARNGWTAATLTAYVQEQTAAQSLRADPHSAMRQVIPTRANSKYSPFMWRR
jgi:hypothetical protein